MSFRTTKQGSWILQAKTESSEKKETGLNRNISSANWRCCESVIWSILQDRKGEETPQNWWNIGEAMSVEVCEVGPWWSCLQQDDSFLFQTKPFGHGWMILLMIFIIKLLKRFKSHHFFQFNSTNRQMFRICLNCWSLLVSSQIRKLRKNFSFANLSKQQPKLRM